MFFSHILATPEMMSEHSSMSTFFNEGGFDDLTNVIEGIRKGLNIKLARQRKRVAKAILFKNQPGSSHKPLTHQSLIESAHAGLLSTIRKQVKQKRRLDYMRKQHDETIYQIDGAHKSIEMSFTVCINIVNECIKK